jgi:tRNA-specific 2-thiouridylase
LVALSGGVDSSVAAALLLDEGHDVVGATMKLWGGSADSGCCSVADVEDARRSASQLGIDHHVFDYTAEFESAVVTPYVEEHFAGRTPNPCIECNRHLKFDLLVRRAELLGFDAVATGHHARIVLLRGRPHLGRGRDAAKDQSYVLYPLCGELLARVRFPVGELTKAEVRRRAAALGLRTATKPDSQDVCFVTRADGRHRFLSSRGELHPATVLDERGEARGSVDAVETITVGQRRGLGLAGGSQRRFVTHVDVVGRTVHVGPIGELSVEHTPLEALVWAHEPVAGPVTAQCSAHGSATDASVLPGAPGEALLRWDLPRRRVAPGQSVVLYSDGCVVGGGIAAEEPVPPRGLSCAARPPA